MAPTTPVPEHLQKEMKALQEKMRAVQEKMQAISLSSHPQPSAAITISYDGRRSPSTASGKPPRATIKTTEPSESKFYASTAGSSESLDLHSPIAPAYASAITQPSVQDSPDSHFQEFVGSNKSL
ncbi:hypothetical protein BGZ97_010868 [Linnemannia gamsii]|uniref:Uncharacterized protein n=1 Tax=Linnemannia gamsii TaxID=64522 RepID=A0A9P6UDR5_9FUNG|nr:hypothetical protein BGZ97_010868 [Linnemannia gamsii]